MCEVADDGHLAVRDEVGCAFRIAQNSDAEGNLLDLAGEAAEVVAADFHDIADHVLLLEQNEKASEVVFDERLRAEGDGKAKDGGARAIRTNGNGQREGDSYDMELDLGGLTEKAESATRSAKETAQSAISGLSSAASSLSETAASAYDAVASTAGKTAETVNSRR